MSDSNPNGTSSLRAIGSEESSRKWIGVVHPGVDDDVVEPRQISLAKKSFGWSAPSANETTLAGVREMLDCLVPSSAYSISDSDSYTMYLPLVLNRFTHPLLNGDFEIVDGDFARYWEWEGDLSVSITNTLSNESPCYSGTYCTLLGSPDYPCNKVPLGYGRICQTFGVPPTGMPKLTFHYRIFSYDECKEGRFDCFEAYMDDMFDEAPPTLLLRDGSKDGKYGCEEDKLDITDWKEPPELDLSAIPNGNGGTVDYRGKTVQLCFYNHSRELPGYTVAWYNTWVYLDDVRVEQD